jgi:hypothetical protein
MASIFDKLRNWLNGSSPAPQPSGRPTTHAVPLDDAAVERLMMALSMTNDDEMSCAASCNQPIARRASPEGAVSLGTT